MIETEPNNSDRTRVLLYERLDSPMGEQMSALDPRPENLVFRLFHLAAYLQGNALSPTHSHDHHCCTEASGLAYAQAQVLRGR